MVIEVKAELQGVGSFLAGERISAVVTFSNKGGREDTVAWAGAQLHCQCSWKGDLVNLSSLQPPLLSPATETAFVPNRGEKGVTLFSTPSTILIINLLLQAGESRTVHYSEQIPVGGPPSFSGCLVRYSYKLTVGAQKPNCPTHLFRLPFRVLTIPDALKTKEYAHPSPKSTNPFLVAEEKEYSDLFLECAHQALAMETSRKTSISYTLKSVSSSSVLGRMCLFKACYKLGEDIIGSISFSPTTTCLQYHVMLQCIEEVPDNYKQPSVCLKPVCTPHARHSECCLSTRHTHFSLPVPLSVTQVFSTDAVSVHWQLHFKFLMSRVSPSEMLKSSVVSGLSGCKAIQWQGLQTVAMETLIWDLPVTILPTIPMQLDQSRSTVHTLDL